MIAHPKAAETRRKTVEGYNWPSFAKVENNRGKRYTIFNVARKLSSKYKNIFCGKSNITYEKYLYFNNITLYDTHLIVLSDLSNNFNIFLQIKKKHFGNHNSPFLEEVPSFPLCPSFCDFSIPNCTSCPQSYD